MEKIIKDSNGKVLLSSGGAYKVTAAIDSNIQAGNIKKDVNILGVTGTFEGDTDGLNGFLAVESKTIATSASATANIAYNKKCGIIDENNLLWDTLDWHQRWVDNGYSADGLSKPVGIWMEAYGLHLKYLWPLDAPYSDATGTIANTAGQQVFVYNWTPPFAATAADRTVWPANQTDMIAHGTAGKYNSATWRAVVNGDGLDMVALNTGETFTIPSRDVGNANAFMKDNNEDYMESYYKQCEFLKALFAICSGIAVPTGTVNGDTTAVEIYNANGEQAAVGEDMYFFINGANTGLKAKYNPNCFPNAGANVTTGLLTQTIADAIYNKQVSNGVNMNDTGVNSATKRTKCLGVKDAEAIAVNGYWYIKTPFISNPSTLFNVAFNIVDAPATYLCRNKSVTLATEKMLYPYWLNKATHITAIVNLLRTTEGLSSYVPSVVSACCWSTVRFGTNYSNAAWFVDLSNGSVFYSQTHVRYVVLPCALQSEVFTKANINQ